MESDPNQEDALRRQFQVPRPPIVHSNEEDCDRVLDSRTIAEKGYNVCKAGDEEVMSVGIIFMKKGH